MIDDHSHEASERGRRREQLARFLRLDAPFHEIVSRWAGFGVHGEQTTHSTAIQLGESDARFLDLPVGTTVLRRDLYLVPILRGPAFLAASVTELVYEPRLHLDLAGRTALRTGADPLELVAAHLSRTVCGLERPPSETDAGAAQEQHAPPQDDRLTPEPAQDPTPNDPRAPQDVALCATTVLARAGVSVALARETVYWRLVTHRTPDLAHDRGHLRHPCAPITPLSTPRAGAEDSSNHSGTAHGGGDPARAV